MDVNCAGLWHKNTNFTANFYKLFVDFPDFWNDRSYNMQLSFEQILGYEACSEFHL